MKGQAYLQHWPLIRQVLQDHIDLEKVRYSQHAGERMEERGITKKMVESILYHNNPSEMHEAKKYPFGEQPYTNADPVLTVVGKYENRKLAVGLAIKKRNQGILFAVVTAMFPEHGRHVQ
ncbi:hypothetical protein ABD76_25910 [Paenibacillus dendritiformis]|uniref:DUF4258 domain-containing protein n=1 Tax=Paenibacillus dendritiformis TaxID=130049 RepID=UPI0018CE6E45|nr:DUF4258 domain-containing protein [Paenibacillus dendritiformis]MBG9795334.1 hypothetical protein [Paenibacillus dendritiformis]MBG9795625.1 hypothetical protein [Paenibacillus dendritiformis]MBG9795694.1 hypothetical protein [Paenibacillus dendritiformis]MBG9795710.1 hypothetical protein [Paenibacillus dendritiformis]